METVKESSKKSENTLSPLISFIRWDFEFAVAAWNELSNNATVKLSDVPTFTEDLAREFLEIEMSPAVFAQEKKIGGSYQDDADASEQNKKLFVQFATSGRNMHEFTAMVNSILNGTRMDSSLKGVEGVHGTAGFSIDKIKTAGFSPRMYFASKLGQINALKQGHKQADMCKLDNDLSPHTELKTCQVMFVSDIQKVSQLIQKKHPNKDKNEAEHEAAMKLFNKLDTGVRNRFFTLDYRNNIVLGTGSALGGGLPGYSGLSGGFRFGQEDSVYSIIKNPRYFYEVLKEIPNIKSLSDDEIFSKAESYSDRWCKFFETRLTHDVNDKPDAYNSKDGLYHIQLNEQFSPLPMVMSDKYLVQDNIGMTPIQLLASVLAQSEKVEHFEKVTSGSVSADAKAVGKEGNELGGNKLDAALTSHKDNVESGLGRQLDDETADQFNKTALSYNYLIARFPKIAHLSSISQIKCGNGVTTTEPLVKLLSRAVAGLIMPIDDSGKIMMQSSDGITVKECNEYTVLNAYNNTDKIYAEKLQTALESAGYSIKSDDAKLWNHIYNIAEFIVSLRNSFSAFFNSDESKTAVTEDDAKNKLALAEGITPVINYNGLYEDLKQNVIRCNVPQLTSIIYLIKPLLNYTDDEINNMRKNAINCKLRHTQFAWYSDDNQQILDELNSIGINSAETTMASAFTKNPDEMISNISENIDEIKCLFIFKYHKVFEDAREDDDGGTNDAGELLHLPSNVFDMLNHGENNFSKSFITYVDGRININSGIKFACSTLNTYKNEILKGSHVDVDKLNDLLHGINAGSNYILRTAKQGVKQEEVKQSIEVSDDELIRVATENDKKPTRAQAKPKNKVYTNEELDAELDGW